jgi:hypothetical protein
MHHVGGRIGLAPRDGEGLVRCRDQTLAELAHGFFLKFRIICFRICVQS